MNTGLATVEWGRWSTGNGARDQNLTMLTIGICKNKKNQLRAILNKSWRQHPTRHQLYGHLHPITKTIQVWRTRHAGHCWRSKGELISDVLLWTPAYDRAKAERPARTYIHSYVRIRDVALKTCQRRGMIGRNGERVSGISVLAAWHNDDDDDYSAWVNPLKTLM